MKGEVMLQRVKQWREPRGVVCVCRCPGWWQFGITWRYIRQAVQHNGRRTANKRFRTSVWSVQTGILPEKKKKWNKGLKVFSCLQCTEFQIVCFPVYSSLLYEFGCKSVTGRENHHWAIYIYIILHAATHYLFFSGVFDPSICTHKTPRETMSEFSWNLILKRFILMKIRHK